MGNGEWAIYWNHLLFNIIVVWLDPHLFLCVTPDLCGLCVEKKLLHLNYPIASILFFNTE